MGTILLFIQGIQNVGQLETPTVKHFIAFISKEIHVMVIAGIGGIVSVSQISDSINCFDRLKDIAFFDFSFTGFKLILQVLAEFGLGHFFTFNQHTIPYGMQVGLFTKPVEIDFITAFVIFASHVHRLVKIAYKMYQEFKGFLVVLIFL